MIDAVLLMVTALTFTLLGLTGSRPLSHLIAFTAWLLLGLIWPATGKFAAVSYFWFSLGLVNIILAIVDILGGRVET